MGYMRHHAIVVTSSLPDQIEAAHAFAVALGVAVSPLIKSPVNGCQSFLVAPDGSKEGWAESEAGDDRRDKFICWLDEQRYGDGSTSLAWVAVQYGDDEDDTRVIAHSDEEWRTLAFKTEP